MPNEYSDFNIETLPAITLKQIASKCHTVHPDVIEHMANKALSSLSSKLSNEEVNRIAEKWQINIAGYTANNPHLNLFHSHARKATSNHIEQAILEALSLVRGEDAELLEDKKRLDWLEKYLLSGKDLRIFEQDKLLNINGHLIRTAIDSAIQNENK